MTMFLVVSELDKVVDYRNDILSIFPVFSIIIICLLIIHIINNDY